MLKLISLKPGTSEMLREKFGVEWRSSSDGQAFRFPNGKVLDSKNSLVEGCIVYRFKEKTYTKCVADPMDCMEIIEENVSEAEAFKFIKKYLKFKNFQ